MDLGYYGFLAAVLAFFGGAALWLRHQAKAFDRKYGHRRIPGE